MILRLRRNADHSTGVKDWGHTLMPAESCSEDEILHGKYKTDPEEEEKSSESVHL